MQSSLSASVYALAGAGKAALLEVLPENLSFPENLCLILVDAERPEGPAQVNLLSEATTHARENGQYPVFVLTKAEKAPALRSVMARLTGRLHDLGWFRPEIFPVCAEAACLFLLPTKGREFSEREQAELTDFYLRFGPAENCLAGSALTQDLTCRVGNREVSPLQLRLALENTGVPALVSRLEELSESGCPAAGTAPAAAALQTAEPPAQAEPALPAAEPEGVQAPETSAAAAASEPVDQAAWMERIEAAAPDEIEELAASVRTLPVDEAASAELRAAVNRRRWTLQCEAMDRLVSGYETMDCSQLLTLAQTVRDSDYPDAIREKTLSLLHDQFQSRELTELRERTLGCEDMDLPELTELKEQIEQGPYTAQSKAPYLELINHQMDALHIQAMEEACAGLEEADAGTLTEMREFVDGYDCADVLKSDLYRRMELRGDELDRLELEALTEGAELKSPAELEELERILSEGSWNPKLINGFRYRVSLCRESAIAAQLREELADLDSMDRRSVLDLRDSIAERGLPERIRAVPMKRLDERIYRLDTLRLLTIENDFDSLGFDDIDGLRTRVSREDVCDRSKVEYLEKLTQREHARIYENAASHSALAQQIAAQFKLRLADFDFSVNAENYDGKLKKFWGGTGLEQPRDIPAFLLDNASTLAFSGQRFWYKTNRGLAFLPLEEIDRFQSMKQMLSVTLQIVRKDSTYLLTDAKLFRANSNAVLDFLNECLRRWPEQSLPDHITMHPIRTPGFDAGKLTQPIPEGALTENGVLEILRARCAAEKLKDGNVAGADPEAWQAKTRKLLQTVGLPETTKIAWFDTSGILGSIKEAIAIGPAGIYVFNGKQPVRTIGMDEIYSLARSGKRAVLTTLQNQTENLDLPLDMVAALSDYIRGIQLCRFESGRARSAE